jgi:hypothetical protein
VDLSGQVLLYRYCSIYVLSPEDPEVIRIAPVVPEAGLSEEERAHRWKSPMEEEDPLAKCANEQEK